MTEHLPSPPTETNSSEEKPSWLLSIVILPKHLGEAIFMLIKKDDASEPSKFILGYLVLLGLIILALSIFSPEVLTTLLQYFFPLQG